MARMGVVLTDWMNANHLDVTAIQCWTSVQQNFGYNVCTLMSMMSEKFMPSACEVDVTGVLTTYAMQLASVTPAALVDWNNNYADDDDKCVLFHCGNWAKSFLPDIQIANVPILGSILGVENTYGALDGRTPEGPLTYGRITTADAEGKIRCYVGEGELTNDELKTFGNRAVAKVPKLQGVLRHHVKATSERRGMFQFIVGRCIFTILLFLALPAALLTAPQKPRIIVLTDISPANVEPDDMESMIRLLVHVDLLEIEALVATTGWSSSSNNAQRTQRPRTSGVCRMGWLFRLGNRSGLNDQSLCQPVEFGGETGRDTNGPVTTEPSRI